MSESKKRRMEITIETHSLTIIRAVNGKLNSAFCEKCRVDVNVLSPAAAALIFRVSADFLETIFRSDRIHNVGENALCGDSLAGYFKQQVRFIED